MAYSPSPSLLVAERRSVTPPAQPMSKRDKRRNQHVARQDDFQNDFNSNREHHYRTQLIALQHDLNLVSQADPYGPDPIEDAPDEIARLIEMHASGTAYQSEMSSLAGRWYTEFVHEVNEAKEAKEKELIDLSRQHKMRLERLKYECDYRLHLAAQEADHMSTTLRERLVQTLTSKRQKLMKEKEQLDIADTNALLLHPSQFSITNPTSPGGGTTSRKTRTTRHRGDHEDITNGYNGDVPSKRKRKLAEEDYGSPSRHGVATPAERARATNVMQQTDKAYSINQLFTDKELNFQSHQAQIAARHFFSTSRKEGESNGTGKRAKDDDADRSNSGEESGADGDEDLEAPGMERTASQNVHVTRSTRNIGAMAGLNILSDLAEKAATRPTLPYATLYTHQGKNGTFLPQPSRLMAEELEEDLCKISQLKTGAPGEEIEKLAREALKPVGGARSNLAPDWPVYLDVHLVDIDPRRSTAAS